MVSRPVKTCQDLSRPVKTRQDPSRPVKTCQVPQDFSFLTVQTNHKVSIFIPTGNNCCSPNTSLLFSFWPLIIRYMQYKKNLGELLWINYLKSLLHPSPCKLMELQLWDKLMLSCNKRGSISTYWIACYVNFPTSNQAFNLQWICTSYAIQCDDLQPVALDFQLA